MPAHWWANHLPVRPMPHRTSSIIISQPRSSHRARSCCRYSTRMGFTPPSPWMVSKNTATTLGLPSVAFDGLDVVQRHADETLDQRAKAAVDLGVAGGRHGGDGAAVEGLFVHHDLGFGDALVHAVFACDLDGGLVGFQPELQKNTLVMPERSTSLAASCFPAAAVVVVGVWMSLVSWSCSAGTSLAWLCPSVFTAMPPSASRYSLPFTSHTRQPWPASAIGTRP